MLLGVEGARVHVVLPVHPSPRIQEPVTDLLEGHPSITLTEPLPYEAMVLAHG